MLRNLSAWLDVATAHAEARGFDPEILLSSRLVPDQWPLSRQIQASCDAAKFIAARLSDTSAPEHPDDESTLDELRARIASTCAYLEGFSAADLEGAGELELFLPFLQGGSVMAPDYLREFALPNFYFHVTTAYAILRHNGVSLGKQAYIGSMNIKPPPG
ncbi:MAG TPA: DUF1993 domain-containing protein [Deltaproteobacteria bacterium]|nr:DUF1993 domain-containing protein [Deltaproteobacteria bacterium]